MMDAHDRLDSFGVMPEIFGIATYSLLVGLGLIVGVLYLMRIRRMNNVQTNDSSAQPDPVLIIVAAALIFGTIGTKIPTLLSNPTLAALLTDKSIVGGLLGGMAGVMIVKRLLHIRLQMGNSIAPAAALGLAIGRLGCFFNGCCYGIPASWGVDFGDGLLRLPTQLFEVAFHLTAFVLLHLFRDRVQTPGILFKLYVINYFIFRFFLEFIRVNPAYWQSLTLYQLLCLVGIVWMAFLIARQKMIRPIREREATP